MNKLNLHWAVKFIESVMFFIGGEQNGTWTKKSLINSNPKKNFEMTEGPTMHNLLVTEIMTQFVKCAIVH